MEISMDSERGVFQYEQLDRTIMEGIVKEKSNQQIADEVGYSLGTIKFRLGLIYKHLGVKTKAGLVREVFQKKIIS
jgi:DNA-binding NarL/FixJ family response regulator